MIGKKRGRFVLVFSILLILSLALVQAINGCYYYPGDDPKIVDEDNLFCIPFLDKILAEEDCQQQQGCEDINQYFIPNSDCDPLEIPQCERVMCDVDCVEHTLSVCQAKGGDPVPEDLEDALCQPGCCVIDRPEGKICATDMLDKSCKNSGEDIGVPVQFFNYIGANDPSTCASLCASEEEITASLTVEVKNVGDDPQPILESSVELLGTEIPLIDAAPYNFPSIPPGVYLVKASAPGYYPSQQQVSLSPGDETTITLFLELMPEAVTLKGRVVKAESLEEGINGVEIIFSGASQVNFLTADIDGVSGSFSVEAPPGSYDVVLTHEDHKTGFAQIIVTPEPEEQSFGPFELLEKTGSSISGTTMIVFDPESPPVAEGAAIYINGQFRGNSHFQTGVFEIDIEPTPEGEEYILTAFKNDYSYTSDDPFEVAKNQQKDLGNLELITYEGECSCPSGETRPVNSFTAKAIKGKKQVNLTWGKPCAEVLNYVLTINDDQIEIPPSINKYIHEGDWDEDYTYSILVKYPKVGCEEGLDDGQPFRLSTADEEVITMGDEECEGKFDPSHEFCIYDDRDTVYGCDQENFIYPSKECSTIPGNFLCSPASEMQAVCSDASFCSLSGQPFGLYHSPQNCYEVNNPLEDNIENACYYDHTEFSTADKCDSCDNIDSCFQYQSKNSCEINNCLGAIEECQWVGSSANPSLISYGELLSNIDPTYVSEETGSGYCVPTEKYSGTSIDKEANDFCPYCGPGEDSTLFENYYCTADICTNLGRCFSNENLNQCESCEKTPTLKENCISYKTELECSNGQNFEVGEYANLLYSEDSCNWERCSWTGTNCIKDGDGDEENDCTGSGVPNCLMDNKAPKTELKSNKVVSLISPEVIFEADDELHEYESQKSSLKAVYYCLTSAHPEAIDTCTKDKFVEELFVGLQKKIETTVNLIDFPDLGLTSATGSAYNLKYYSKDNYNNQEDVKQSSVFIDNVPPIFKINEEIDTVGDVTELTIYVESNGQPLEPMRCDFELEQFLPDAGVVGSKKVLRNQNPKQAIFSELKGIGYKVNVTCTDDNGNVHDEFKSIVFNLDQQVQIIYPPLNGIISETNVQFEVNTAVGSICELYRTKTNEKIPGGLFLTNEEGKIHKTNSVQISKLGSPIKVGDYAGEYKVICKELLSEIIHDKTHFNFEVDKFGPETQIVLNEADRPAEMPTVFDWERTFIQPVEVSFICQAEGIECDKTLYCLGNSCGSIGDPNYLEYEGSFQIEDDTRICYYSTDLANNLPSFTCGDIKIEGFDIVLEKPNSYIYQGELYGISNQNQFDWQFFTKVPTEICKFNFAPGFDYDTVEPFKVLNNDGGKYLFPEFPSGSIGAFGEEGGIKQLYLQCRDSFNFAHPEKKLNLEYDPSKPVIISTGADPELLVEGSKVKLLVETDDKTLCRYSHNSDGLGTENYEAMSYEFPGHDEGELHKKHSKEIEISFVNGEEKKDYLLNVMCMNGAGDLSEMKELKFSVDYTAIGNIIYLSPKDEYFRGPEIDFLVETSKISNCQYEFSNSTELFTTEEGRKHTATVSATEEKKYIVPIKCLISGEEKKNSLSFTIDKSLPIIKKIEGIAPTCGLDHLKLRPYTNEEKIKEYYYEVYELDTKDDFLITPAANLLTGVMVYNSTIGPDLPLKLSLNNFNSTVGNKYRIKMRVIDAAGNTGSFKESDMFEITHANFSSCVNDTEAPNVYLESEETCTGLFAELNCEDDLTCYEFKYGVSPSADSCKATQNYVGNKIEIEEDTYICYEAKDLQNNVSGTLLVKFPDDDADGITNSCDLCKETIDGGVADENGCTSDQFTSEELKSDLDKDGLPDNWEKLYNQEGCEYDQLSEDSNNNGIVDSLEDYDSDGFNSFAEYMAETNPCIADEPETDDKESQEDEEATDGLEKITAEEANVTAWIFLILGLLFILGGFGYLIYFYVQFKNQPSDIKKSSTPSLFSKSPTTKKKPKSAWGGKFALLNRLNRKRSKTRKREKIFSDFNKSSTEIPHIKKIITKKPTLDNLHELAHKYKDNKKYIAPGLKTGEKGIFSKLDDIAKKTKDKNIDQVATKEEANDIFSKLKDISKKRKK